MLGFNRPIPLVFLQLRWTTARRADFYELLAGFTADGLPIFEALTEIHRQYQRFGEPL